MNILLCMPKANYNWNEWPVLPAGIAYVSSSLKAVGYNVYTLNFITEKRTVQEAVSQMIVDHDISIIGCGDLVVNYLGIKSILDAAKEIEPEIITFMGGGFVTFSPIEAMTLIPSADYGIIGEGEITANELMYAIMNMGDISKVDGIIYRSENGIIIKKR